jgi:glucokinase
MPEHLVAGIDLSGTNLQFGVVDASNEILGRARGKTQADRGLEQVIANVATGIHAACGAAGVGVDDLAAIGVVVAGATDIPRGVVLEAPNLRWQNVPLRDLLSERFGCTIVVDNDVNGAVWGEYCLGAGRDAVDMLGVWIGTGVGGGLVLHDRLYHGKFFTAGEIGHTVFDPNGEPGQRIVEDICSRTAMQRVLGADVGTAEIAEAFRRGDGPTCAVVQRSASVLGMAIANWVTVLSLDTVVLGGGITEALGEPYLDMIRESFDRVVFPDKCRACRLIMTTLAADSGLLGAALLARAGAEI